MPGYAHPNLLYQFVEKFDVYLRCLSDLYTGNSVRVNFQLKQAIINFWTKLGQKTNSRSKTEKVDITIKFSIFKLDLAPNSILNRQICFFFGPELPKKSGKMPRCETMWKLVHKILVFLN